jgi:hypothetical protein
MSEDTNITNNDNTPVVDVSNFTPGQNKRIGIIYETIAKLLPTEGRDYKIEFTPGDNDSIKIRFIPNNEIGSLWATYLQQNLQAAITSSTCGANKSCRLRQ